MIINKLTIPKLIAHRGASGESPENTLAAFQKAIELGINYIELDVRLSKDHVPVIIHDETLLRTTGKQHNHFVHDLTFSQIKTHDVGSWFHDQFTNTSIPTLEEALKATSHTNSKTGLMIEIKKGPQSPQIIVDSILNAITRCNYNRESIILGSFCVTIIEQVMKRDPTSKVIGIVEEPHKIDEFLNLGVKHLALWHPLITPHSAESLHERGVTIWTFTVDDPEKMKFLASLSIDGIITNHPRSMLEFIK